MMLIDSIWQVFFILILIIIRFIKPASYEDIRPKKKFGYWVWVLGLDPNPETQAFLGITNYEFYSIHFGVIIKIKFMSEKNL